MSAQLRFDGVAFEYDAARTLFSDLSFQLAPGWTGIVGPNGAGKTTLLRLISGALQPTAGSVHLANGARAHLCAQELAEPPSELWAFAWDYEGVASRWISRLEIQRDTLERWPTLSSGERKRWQIAWALSEAPQVLLLDEPTNHLDAGACELLLAALREYRGIGLVVSHDRAFLDALTERTLRLQGGAATVHPGSYSQARDDWELKAAAQRDARDQLVQQQRRTARLAQRKGEARAAAAKQLSARNRMSSVKDSDARTVAARRRVEKAEARIARQRSVAVAARDRLDAKLAEMPFEKQLGGDIHVGFDAAPRRRLVVHEARWIDRDSRVHLRGDNGSGKSTLVRALVARWDLAPERLLYLPQELGPDARREIAAQLGELDSEARGRAMQILANLGVDPKTLGDVLRASPGELRKLAMALGLARRAWLLILDEPTNHLDLPSIERLQAALYSYPGALLLVSHDAELAARCCSETWTPSHHSSEPP